MGRSQLVCGAWVIQATSCHPAHPPRTQPLASVSGRGPGLVLSESCRAELWRPRPPPSPGPSAVVPSTQTVVPPRLGSAAGAAEPRGLPPALPRLSPPAASPLPSSWNLSAPHLSAYFHIILASAIGFLILVLLFVCSLFWFSFFFFSASLHPLQAARLLLLLLFLLLLPLVTRPPEWLHSPRRPHPSHRPCSGRPSLPSHASFLRPVSHTLCSVPLSEPPEAWPTPSAARPASRPSLPLQLQ